MHRIQWSVSVDILRYADILILVFLQWSVSVDIHRYTDILILVYESDSLFRLTQHVWQAHSTGDTSKDIRRTCMYVYLRPYFTPPFSMYKRVVHAGIYAEERTGAAEKTYMIACRVGELFVCDVERQCTLRRAGGTVSSGIQPQPSKTIYFSYFIRPSIHFKGVLQY